jgi:hypothetical protein
MRNVDSIALPPYRQREVECRAAIDLSVCPSRLGLGLGRLFALKEFGPLLVEFRERLAQPSHGRLANAIGASTTLQKVKKLLGFDSDRVLRVTRHTPS